MAMSSAATAGRKYIDCSEYPSDSNCSLRISGTEDEVLPVAMRHAAEVHGHPDTVENREQLRQMLKDE
jgi:predicted small metal-binding protein